MNTQDFSPVLYSWEEIFKLQKELKFQFEPEAKDLFLNFDIDCYEDQEAFKRYCWRIVEELAEGMEARFAYLESPSSERKQHVSEECIDALNFTIELMLLYGWGPDRWDLGDPPYIYGTDESKFGLVIYRLGLAANCLKNRQWRKSQYLVDLYAFERRFQRFITYIYSLLLRLIGSDQEIRKFWSLKYQVNKFRIETNY